MIRPRAIALALPLLLLCVIGCAVGWQIVLSIPLAAETGPMEWLDTALLAALAVAFAGIAAFQHGRRASLWWTASAGMTVVFIVSLADFLPESWFPFDATDYANLAGWTAMLLVLLSLRRSAIVVPRVARLGFVVGFALQTVVVVLSLADGYLLPAASQTMGRIFAASEIVELAYLGLYCCAAAITTRAVIAFAFTQPAASRGAGLGVPAWIERRLGPLFRLPLARRLRILAEQWRFANWQRRNPGLAFADYYAQQITDTLRRGQPHRTLGTNAYALDAMIGGKGQRTAGEFRKDGIAKFEALRQWGLQPDQRVVDYGCGSLRVGQHLIRYLDAGKYTGIDVTDAFYSAGLKILGPELCDAKRPSFAVIDEATIARLASNPPDVVVSVAVVMHVAPAEIELFFERVLRLMGPHTRAMIHVDIADRELRTAPKSWAYPAERLRAIVARRRPELRFDLTVEQSRGRLAGTEWCYAVIKLDRTP